MRFCFLMGGPVAGVHLVCENSLYSGCVLFPLCILYCNNKFFLNSTCSNESLKRDARSGSCAYKNTRMLSHFPRENVDRPLKCRGPPNLADFQSKMRLFLETICLLLTMKSNSALTIRK